MFERKHQKLVPVSVFAKRMVFHASLVLLLLLAVLFIGISGYHWLANLSWVDSLLNASMILGGMGPVDTLTATNAKIFASVYALFSGLVVIAAMGIILVPIMHRVLHAFHIQDNS